MASYRFAQSQNFRETIHWVYGHFDTPTLTGKDNELMTFWAPVSPNTVFEGVQEVSPGEMVVRVSG